MGSMGLCGNPPPATKVSATNVSHRPKGVAETAGIAEISRTVSVLGRELERRHEIAPQRRRSTNGGATARWRRSCPRCVRAKTKGLAVASQALDLSGGAKRDRTVDLYNAIVALSQLSYGPETSGTARRYNSCPAHWQQRLAVAFALVVFDLHALDLDVLGVVGQVVRLFQRLLALDIGKLVAGQRRLVALLLGREFRRRQAGVRRRPRCRRRRAPAPPAPDLHAVLPIILAPPLPPLHRPFVQIT